MSVRLGLCVVCVFNKEIPFFKDQVITPDENFAHLGFHHISIPQ